jgi:hypothetical protein
MTDKKDLFLDDKLKTGGFYELCIQVCPSIDNQPIKLYTDFLWSLDKVEGPYDNEFRKTSIDISNLEHRGLLTLENKYIPFRTFNIREDEPIETGFNWFDIYFYTTAIEEIFGRDYKTWTENPNPPKAITNFFHWTMKELYKIYPFQLAFIDFEVSGQYYLHDLKTKLINPTNTKFYVGRETIDLIKHENKDFVISIE